MELRQILKIVKRFIFLEYYSDISAIINSLPKLKNIIKCSWGYSKKSTLRLLSTYRNDGRFYIYAIYKGRNKKLWIPFKDNISLRNALTV